MYNLTMAKEPERMFIPPARFSPKGPKSNIARPEAVNALFKLSYVDQNSVIYIILTKVGIDER